MEVDVAKQSDDDPSEAQDDIVEANDSALFYFSNHDDSETAYVEEIDYSVGKRTSLTLLILMI